MEKYWDIYYGSASQFTTKVTEEINKLICDMGFKPQNEYYRIDAIGWEAHENDAKQEAAEVELNCHQWDLKIAVEHENNHLDWTDELTKLVHIRCPLKVIIGYNHWDCRGELEYKKIEYAAKWMKQIKAFDSAAREEYLIILGNTYAKNGKGKSKDFDYRGYVYDYDKEEFIRLEAENHE